MQENDIGKGEFVEYSDPYTGDKCHGLTSSSGKDGKVLIINCSSSLRRECIPTHDVKVISPKDVIFNMEGKKRKIVINGTVAEMRTCPDNKFVCCLEREMCATHIVTMIMAMAEKIGKERGS